MKTFEEAGLPEMTEDENRTLEGFIEGIRKICEFTLKENGDEAFVQFKAKFLLDLINDVDSDYFDLCCSLKEYNNV